MKNEMSLPEPARTCCMVVEDDEGIRNFMGAFLKMTTGVEPACFSSAAEALPAFTAAPGHYKCIITDFDMPGMNGLDFGRRVLELFPTVKILLVTGNPAITENGARGLGFCGVVRKPFPGAALWKALEAAAI